MNKIKYTMFHKKSFELMYYMKNFFMNILGNFIKLFVN